MRKTNNLGKWSSFFKECQNQFPTDIKLLIDPSISKDQILASLKQISANQEDYIYLNKVIKSRKLQASKGYYKFFDELDKNKKTKKFSIQFHEVTKDRSYLSLILRLFMGIEVNNKKLVDLTLEELVKIPAFYMTLDIENKVQFSKRKKFSIIYLNYLKKLWNFQCDENLKKMFLQRQIQISDSEINKVVEDIFSDFFVDKFAFDSNDYIYGISHPSYWLASITTEGERSKFIQKYFESPAHKKIKFSEFEIIKYYLPKKSTLREKLAKNIEKNFDHFHNYEIDSLLKSIENQPFKKYLGSKNSLFKRPTFTIKKNIYLKGMANNEFGFYGFFELMKLGYQNNLFLWWLL